MEIGVTVIDQSEDVVFMEIFQKPGIIASLSNSGKAPIISTCKRIAKKIYCCITYTLYTLFLSDIIFYSN